MIIYQQLCMDRSWMFLVFQISIKNINFIQKKLYTSEKRSTTIPVMRKHYDTGVAEDQIFHDKTEIKVHLYIKVFRITCHLDIEKRKTFSFCNHWICKQNICRWLRWHIEILFEITLLKFLVRMKIQNKCWDVYPIVEVVRRQALIKFYKCGREERV